MKTLVDSTTVDFFQKDNEIVCQLRTIVDLSKIKAYQVVKDSSGWNSFLKRNDLEVRNDFLDFNTYGHSKCNEKVDTFNKKFGEQLAELRAQNEALKIVSKVYTKMKELAMLIFWNDDIMLIEDNVYTCRQNLKKFMKKKVKGLCE